MTFPTTSRPILYFGYGSNLWREQMTLRCPTSSYVGIGRLDKFNWFINERGYANVKPTSDDSYVYGLIYTLTPSDEAALDRNEGVPDVYKKVGLPVHTWLSDNGNAVDTVTQKSELRDVLVYIDRDRIMESEPKEEYIYRMNKGVEDALASGIPSTYVDSMIRRFIPETLGVNATVKDMARRQAQRFGDERDDF